MPDTKPLSTSGAKVTPPKGWRSFAVLALVVIGLNAAFYSYYRLTTYHFAEVQPAVLYRSGNQGVLPLSAGVRKSQSKTIVSLIDDQELADPKKPQFKQEIAYASNRGLKLIRVPVKLGGWPTSADVQAFLAAATDKNNQPVLVHCAQGVRRTGMMVAAYQMSVLGYDKARAAAAIESFGHSDRTIADVKKFIDIYDPVTRTVTQTMTQSEE